MKIKRTQKPELDLNRKLKWLIFFRALFAAVLLGSAFIVGGHENLSFFDRPLVPLNMTAALILILSGFYAAILPYLKPLVRFGYVQLIIDTFLVTSIVYVTGGFSSAFSFLYLVVIIYASMVTFRRGAMIIAIACSIQYGLLVDLEYYSLINPFGMNAGMLAANCDWEYVIYKILITILACFAIAFLSGFLAEQERRAKQDLWAMEEQMMRVEKLAATGEMAAGLAHEIKNPLASMYGAIQILKEDIPFSPDRNRLMEIISRDADRISSLVNEFLLFAKPKPGQAKLIELDNLLDDIVAGFQTDNRHNPRVSIIKNFSPGMYIKIDPEHLRQVMLNLLLNADQAIADQGRIEVQASPEGKKYIRITVTDNGCGMTEDMIKSIFDPFFTKKPKGTGLGLSIVQQIITSYNGLIDVRSAPGKGTRFILKLPRETNPPSHAL